VCGSGSVRDDGVCEAGVGALLCCARCVCGADVCGGRGMWSGVNASVDA
jgi:hypothetical protein